MRGLLEDYKRRLKTVMSEIKKGGNDLTLNRLGTKASCYRTFISELERFASQPAVSEDVAISALRNIVSPILYLEDIAEKDGAKLDGYMAVQLIKNANFYQGIAKKALDQIQSLNVQHK